jgi:8-oxo-dGTP diphosphatase
MAEGIKIEGHNKGVFSVIVIGIIYDPANKKILIGKRSDDPDIPKLSWCFPGGRPEYEEGLETAVKREIKEETGLDVESLGVIHARNYPEKKEFLAIYYLCEALDVKKDLEPGDNFSELKWVSPEKLEDYFTTSFPDKLKEYILNLK